MWSMLEPCSANKQLINRTQELHIDVPTQQTQMVRQHASALLVLFGMTHHEE
jgi:hypothetical protein